MRAEQGPRSRNAVRLLSGIETLAAANGSARWVSPFSRCQAPPHRHYCLITRKLSWNSGQKGNNPKLQVFFPKTKRRVALNKARREKGGETWLASDSLKPAPIR